MPLDLYEESGKATQAQDTSRDLFKEAGLVATVQWPEKKKQEMPLLPRMAREVARQAGATAETAYSVAEGAIVWPISKVAGLTGVLRGGEEMKRREEATAGFLTHKPILRETEAAMEKVGKGFEAIETPQRMAAEELERRGHHRAAYLTKLFSDLFMFKALHVTGAKAKAKIIKESIPKDIKVSQADINRIAEIVPTEKAARLKSIESLRAEEGRPLAKLVEGERKAGIRPYSPEHAARLKQLKTKQLPPGQGFELKSAPREAYSPELTAKLRQKTLPSPERGFVLKEKPPPTLKPQKPGEVRRGGREKEAQISLEISRKKQAKLVAPKEAPKPKQRQNLLGEMEDMKIFVGKDYNLPELRQFKDGKVFKKKGDISLDDATATLKERYPEIKSSDDLVELVKSGRARDIPAPEFRDQAEARLLKKEDAEAYEAAEAEQFEYLAAQKKKAARLKKPTLKAPKVEAKEPLTQLTGLVELRSRNPLIGTEKGHFNKEGISVFTQKSPMGDSKRYVYAKDGEILSGLQVMVKPDGETLITNTYTKPSMQRQGIATKLFQRAQQDYPNAKISTDQSKAGKALVKRATAKGPTLETLGFQTMYESMAKAVAERRAKKKKGPKGKPIDVKDFTTGKVIKQRTWKHHRTGQQLTAPPVWELEKKIVQDMPELRRKPLEGQLENAIRTFEELGLDAKELWYRPIKEAEHKVTLERKVTDRWLRKEVFKDVSHKSRRRIGAFATGRQKRGIGILKSMGVEPVKSLTAQELAVYKKARGYLAKTFNRLNKARRLSGKEEFGKVDNYFTFLRDLSILERMGFNPITTKTQMIQKQFLHLKTTPFRFAKARAKMGVMPVELDALQTLKTYSESAIRHIHMSPVIAKGREMLLQFPEGKGHWVLKEEKPRAAKFLADWLDFQAGQRPVTNIPPLVEKAMFKLNQNLAFAVLSANVRSAIIQPSALVQSFAELGPKYTAQGIKSLVDPKARNFALEKSNVLASRQYDVAITDAIQGIRSGRIGEVKKTLGRWGFKPLQLLDMETAKATWQGAYNKAIKELNYTEKKAINYADDLVTKTQASAMPSDIAPLQRTALGKFVSLFQTFVINEWGFLTKDVLGIKNANITNKQAMSKLSKYIVATTLFNMLYEDVIGISSPFPTPIRAYMEAIEEGKDIPSAAVAVGKELIEKIPIIGGGVRYGSHPLGAGVELLGETGMEATGKRKPRLETAGKWLGVPGTAQIRKTVKAKKRGESTYGQIVGTYTKKAKPRLVGSRRSSRRARLRRARR